MSRYNDGNWHQVEAARLERVAALKVDNRDKGQSASQGENVILSTTDYVYFGGYPPIKHTYKSVTQVGFEGCIDEVRFQETSVDLTKNFNATGVVSGCPVKVKNPISNLSKFRLKMRVCINFFFSLSTVC